MDYFSNFLDIFCCYIFGSFLWIRLICYGFYGLKYKMNVMNDWCLNNDFRLNFLVKIRILLVFYVDVF